MTAVELLGQAQALRHDPSNGSSSGRFKGKGGGSRPHTPDRKPPLSDVAKEQRRMDEQMTIRTKTRVGADNTSAGGYPSQVSTARRYQPHPLKQEPQLTPAQFVLPEKVLSGPVSTTPRIRVSNSNHSNYTLSANEPFHGKPVVIGNIHDVMPSATSMSLKSMTSRDVALAPNVPTTQSYTYAMSVTGNCTT